MDFNLYIIAMITAFLITFTSTPISKWISIKLGAVAYPGDRHVHGKPMPRMGGISIVTGFMITISIFMPMVEGTDIKKTLGIVAGGLLIFLVGFFDDVTNMKAKQKLFFQIMAAVIVVASGIKIDFITWPFVGNETLQLNSDMISMIVTVGWIIGVINAVNLIDGLDGLAAGISSIAAICLMVLAILAGNSAAVIITISLVGACVGFLPYNFNPAKIFMGDTGSMFLGFILAVSSILGLFKGYMVAALIVPVIVLGLPIFDMTFAIVRRLAAGKPIMEADKGHIHHRLMDKGLSHKRTVLTMYAISSAFGILGILVVAKSIYFGLGVFVILIAIIKIITSTTEVNE